MRHTNAYIVLLTVGWWIGCSQADTRPVDIFEEDICSSCRMAISDLSFAAEIVTEAREIYKFDDIGCMEQFSREPGDVKIAARYVIDFESHLWIPYETASILHTSVKTPMGSGKLAFMDSARARQFMKNHTPSAAAEKDCCAEEAR